ncbi:hypothetical protein [Dactylosporangium sp. CS-033363]|uniref:hypothetical protein n=1 Tax=Dactylosporangium sp. CS-033363 TaxID=3239935 RepID=UPI003D8F088C
MLPLVLAARTAGHTVALATAAPVDAAHGLETWPVGGAAPGFRGGGTAAQRSAYFASSAAARAADLIPRADAWSPDLIISDTAEVAGPVAAAVTGARHVIHGLGAMPPMVVWHAYAVHLDTLLSRWGTGTSADDIRDTLYLDVCPPALRRPGEPIWSRTLDLRPTPVPPPAGDAVLGRVAGMPYRDTVLARPASFEDALAMLRGVRDLRINLLLCADPADFGPQPPNVLIARTALPSGCCAQVSTGGPGVLLPALGQGLPQLILTQEQTAPDGTVTHGGAALTINAATPSAVERAMHLHLPRLLADPAFAAAAAWSQVEIAAMSSPAAVVRTLTSQGVPALR